MDYFVVQVYRGMYVSVSRWKNLRIAESFAGRMIVQNDVQKVKVWKGEPVPDIDVHPDLLLVLV